MILTAKSSQKSTRFLQLSIGQMIKLSWIGSLLWSEIKIDQNVMLLGNFFVIDDLLKYFSIVTG